MAPFFPTLVLALSTFHRLASAWTALPLIDPPFYNTTAARANANYTVSVPFAVPLTGGGTQTWNFTVALAEVPALGQNATQFDDARVLLTLYDVWPAHGWGNVSGDAVGLVTPYVPPDGGPDRDPRNWESFWTVSYWPFSAAATNAYDAPGSCEGVASAKCLRVLKQVRGNASTFPEDPACEDVRARWGGAGGGESVFLPLSSRPSPRATNACATTTGKLIPRSYLRSPITWDLEGYVSDVYAAGNDTALRRERERVHLATLAGRQANVVCARVADDEVSKGEPGTGPPPSGGGRAAEARGWRVLVAAGAVAAVVGMR